MYADFAFYSGTYKGNEIPEAQFEALELRAAEMVNFYTRNQAAEYTDATYGPNIKKAACAAADAMYEAEKLKPGTQIVSESVGGQSEHRAAAYGNLEAWQKGTDANVYQAIKRHLMWTGLMGSAVMTC